MQLLDAHAKGHVSISRALAIRLLQDLSTEHEMLPKDYWLRDIEEGPHLKLGGEARILKGFHLRNSERSEIIIRRCHLDDGVLTVRGNFLNLTMRPPLYFRSFPVL